MLIIREPCSPHLLQCFLLLDTVKFWVSVAIEPSVLTDGDILYCVSWLNVVCSSCTLNKKSSPLLQCANFNTYEKIVTASTNDPRILVSVIAVNNHLNDFIKIVHN